MANVFGMDIRRFSVLFLAIIIILALIASFANIKVPQNTSNIQIGSGGGGSESFSYPGPKYIYNKTITLSPSLQDLQYVRASYSNLPAPYYNISPEAYIFFNFSTPRTNVLHLLLNALAWNATKIAPEPYAALLSIASSAYVKINNYTNTTLQPFPLNQNDKENYSKTEIIIKYGKTFEAPNNFQPGWSYPPSDKIIVNPPVYQIINTFSVTTSVILSINNYSYLLYKHTTTNGNITNVYEYYAMNVQGIAYLYANNNLINSQWFSVCFYPQGGSYSSTLSGYVTVPPGVQEEVYATYSVYTTPGFSKHTKVEGNMTYIYYIYYPQGPYYYTTGYAFNWYEYNVTLPIMVKVFNGTNPQTIVGNKIYNSRDFTAYFWYTTWSSDPQSNFTTIITHDYIQIANYTIERTWNAGSVEIIPQPSVQQNGNTINYVLTFNVQSDLIQPPPWISQPIIYNKYAAISWFYLEQNASLAHALYSYIMKTINETDIQYWKFEYFVLAAQFAMYTYNTTSSVFNNLLELESFYENWSLVYANILNLSAWPKLQYFSNLLMFFNVSKIPEIYNSTIYFNISGNYEVYLVDIYNALQYSKWNKIPFGNPYYFETNQTIYFYLNASKQLPYIGQTLGFINTNYVPSIYYATFQYSPQTLARITAIWNGTAWVT
uniref:Uncharacterized protein n=1 Tax=Saccharolobus islandicus TaxID=43080 RepID=Q5W2W5_SACIS|nr:hypothetical protein [Sulfolobus islandicus]CAG38181.1 hypothetical protein [Sulfolobus islandicus]